MKELLQSLPDGALIPVNPKNPSTDYDVHLSANIAISQQHTYNALYQCTTHTTIPYELYKATLFICHSETPTSIPNQMRYAALSPDLRTFFKQKYKWTHATINKIDWEIHSRALNSQRPTHRKTLTQYIHRWLPTHGHPATKIDMTKKCPCCHTALETNDHFLTCQATPVVQEWTKQLQELHTTIKNIQLDPILIYYIILATDQWRTIKTPPIPEFCNDEYLELYNDQCQLGWNQILYGRFTKKWVNIQNAHNTNETLDGVAIMSKTIKAIYKIITNMWKFRCDMKYRLTPSQNITFCTRILLPKVHEIYSQRHLLQELDKLQLTVPYDHILLLQTPKLKHWIKRNETHISKNH